MMEKLTAAYAFEYQKRKANLNSFTAVNLKALGRELRDRFGLTDREALDILANRNVLEIIAAHENPEPEPESDYDGLKVKYRVYKARNGEPVEGCFVLRPDKDPAAVMALRAYVAATDNKVLANDIYNWIGNLNS